MSALAWAVGSWGEELLFVWCFLGPQQTEVESCQEVTHLTDVCTLPFLKHVFETLLAKNELQLVTGVLALFMQRPAFTGSTPVELSSCVGVSLLSFRD